LQAEGWLRQTLGGGAHFRDGQWEGIEALVARRGRLLVVQHRLSATCSLQYSAKSRGCG